MHEVVKLRHSMRQIQYTRKTKEAKRERERESVKSIPRLKTIYAKSKQMNEYFECNTRRVYTFGRVRRNQNSSKCSLSHFFDSYERQNFNIYIKYIVHWMECVGKSVFVYAQRG